MVHWGMLSCDVRGYGRYDSFAGRPSYTSFTKDPPIYGKVYRESLPARDYPCTADSYPIENCPLLERVFKLAYRWPAPPRQPCLRGMGLSLAIFFLGMSCRS